MNQIHYHPVFGKVLSDNRLRIPTSSRSEDGEILDGHIEVDCTHPQYAEWLSAIQNKDQAIARQKAEADTARALRRNSKGT